jgi:fibrillarin-like rRNA methylase
MSLLHWIKKIPYIKSKLAVINPKIDDVLLHFFNKGDELIFLDVGANTGQTIASIHGLLPQARIYSFEPTPEVFAELL